MRAMNRLLAICIILGGYPNLSLAQGVRGNVKLSGAVTIVATGHAILLSWTASQGAASYSVYRSATEGGPYAKIALGIPGTTYTYEAAAVINGQSSAPAYSNSAVVTIPAAVALTISPALSIDTRTTCEISGRKGPIQPALSPSTRMHA